MAVLYPLESRMHQTKSRAKRIILVVWVVPCCLATPFLYPSEAFSNTLHSEHGVISRLTCFITLPEDFRRGYYTFLFLFMYVLPLSFIAGTCFQVARCLLKDIPVHRQGSIRRQEANRRKVAKMVLMVVIAFAVAWTPYFLVSIVTQYQAVNFMERHNFFFTMLAINLFAFLNSCVNPFIYAAMSTRFRNGFFRFFRYCCLLGLCSNDEDSGGLANSTLSAAVAGRKENRVRFSCQAPMSCLIAQSSSDSGSGLQSATSLRTLEHRSISSGSFLFRSLIKKRSSQKIIVQYIKGSGETRQAEKQKETVLPFPSEPLYFQRFHSNRKSNSCGDLFPLHSMPGTNFRIHSTRKWLSCSGIKSMDKDSL